MWTCAPTRNPACTQPDMLAATHEAMPAAPHATTFISSRADMPALRHADKSALPHNYSVHMTPRAPAGLRSRTPSKLSHNPTSQQEGMRT